MNLKHFVSDKLHIIILIFVITIQLASLIIVGFDKKGYHIDEIYTYILSNSYDSNRISHDTQAMTAWNDGTYFNKFVMVEADEAFSYDKVKINNGLDAHPPLYYYIIHTISSFLPGCYSKWIGLILNYVLFIGIQIVLYLLSSDITKSKYCGIATVSLNGGLAAVMDMMLFIRMYALLTFLSLLFVYIHYLIYKKPQKRLYILSALITFLGIYTQYYFAFLALIVTALHCFELLKKRQFKTLITYSALMLAAVAAVFIIYPAAISQISGSDTNNVGNEISKNILDFTEFYPSLLNMTEQINNGFFYTFLYSGIISTLCALVTIAASFLFKMETQLNNRMSDIAKPLLTLELILVLIIITVTHISGKFTYVRYVYYIFPICSLFAVLLCLFVAAKARLNLNILCAGIICLGIIGTISFVTNDICSYTFKDKYLAEQSIIRQCKTKPLILVSNGEVHLPTANLEILRNASQVYMYDIDKRTNIDDILKDQDTKNGAVFMILTDDYWSEGLDSRKVMQQFVDESALLEDYRFYNYSYFSSVFIAE